MAVVTLAFVGLWFAGGADVTARPRSKPKAVVAGGMVALMAIRRLASPNAGQSFSRLRCPSSHATIHSSVHPKSRRIERCGEQAVFAAEQSRRARSKETAVTVLNAIIDFLNTIF